MNTPLDTFVIEPQQPANASIIWMHGLGATAYDFEDIVPLLQLPAGVNVRFIFPQAPTQPVTLNNGMPMPSWYDIYEIDRFARQDQTGIEASALTIRALIDLEVERGIDNQRIILAGFSQGGAMALHVGVRYPKPLAGIMGLSCYLPLEDFLDDEKHAANQSTSIFMAHGTQDDVLPILLSEITQTQLKQQQYRIEAHRYPMGHEVCIQEIRDISQWINTVLATPAH